MMNDDADDPVTECWLSGCASTLDTMRAVVVVFNFPACHFYFNFSVYNFIFFSLSYARKIKKYHQRIGPSGKYPVRRGSVFKTPKKHYTRLFNLRL